MTQRDYTCTEGCWNIWDSQPTAKTNIINPAKEDKALPPKEVSSEVTDNKKQLSIENSPSVPIANEIRRDGRFIAYDNGTVLDTSTNRMWAARDNEIEINWAKAKSYCENYRGGGLCGLADADAG
jgi:hypothetical protein